jgi:hypothetical protein
MGVDKYPRDGIPHHRPGDEIRHNNSGTLDVVLTDDCGSTVRTGEPISTD